MSTKDIPQGVQLDQAQWTSVTQGELQTPDGILWRRQSTRAARRACDQLIAHGSGLVVYWHGGGQLRFYTPTQAPTAWQRLRGQVTATQPTPTHGRVIYTAGIWTDDHDRTLLVLTGHC